jgi:hypothetical protein
VALVALTGFGPLLCVSKCSKTYMPRFPLPAALSDLHDDAIAYASVVQNKVAARGGCKTLSSEALNALMFSAVLTHRSVRTLCEEGWTPIASVLNRTLLDIFANCVAIVAKRADADFMGFKYMTHFQRKWLKAPNVSTEENAGVIAHIEEMVTKLQPAEQAKARTLLAEAEVTPYWFQPEYGSPKRVLELSTHPIYDPQPSLPASQTPAPAPNDTQPPVTSKDVIPPDAAKPATPTAPVAPAVVPAPPADVAPVLIKLEDGTPVHLILSETISSADAQVGQTLELEVVDDIVLDGVCVVPHGSTAWATVTSAQAKRRMGRAGHLDINIDKVKLADGEKAMLRAVKDEKGGSHTGAVTGAVVATSLVLLPAAPLFLLIHGKM